MGKNKDDISDFKDLSKGINFLSIQILKSKQFSMILI